MHLNTLERTNRIITLVDSIESKAAEVACGPAWPERRRPVSYYVGSYVQILLAHLVEADGYRSFDELAVLSRYHHDEFDLREEDDWVKTEVRSTRSPAVLVPEFLTAAARHDAAAGSQLADNMVADIEQICLLICDADGERSSNEVQLISAVVKHLLGCVRGATPPDVESPAPERRSIHGTVSPSVGRSPELRP